MLRKSKRRYGVCISSYEDLNYNKIVIKAI